MPSTRSTDGRTGAASVSRRAADWLWTRLEDGSPIRPTSGGGLAIVLASVAVSLVSYGALEHSMRIRWSVGTHYGPATAPTTVVLVGIPLLVAVAVGVFRGFAAIFERVDAIDGARGAYELAALAVLLCLVLAQLALVVANLL